MKLRPWLLAELRQLGYETPGDMVHLSVAETLRIPGMGGRDWHKIADAVLHSTIGGMQNVWLIVRRWRLDHAPSEVGSVKSAHERAWITFRSARE
ncbi:hypothetical protein QD409_07355 [Rhizobium sp. BR 315]